MKKITRRTFLEMGMLAAVSVPALYSHKPGLPFGKPGKDFQISLAEWSLNRAYYKGEFDHLDFPVIARKEFDIHIIEHVSRFFKETTSSYLTELKKRAKDNGVKNNLIMVGGIGDLGDMDTVKRRKSVESHYQWIDIANYLGCQAIRVNAYGGGSREELAKHFAESLYNLGEYAAKEKINVIVENHGGASSDVPWLLGVMRQVNLKNVGILPDFGNFCIRKTKTDGCVEEYDRYLGVKELMPYAKGVSAKSYDFDAAGRETTIDYTRMLRIVKDSGFKGIIGVEYEGNRLSEYEGIRATKRLIENVLNSI